jgi:maltose O-acetyltransferase
MVKRLVYKILLSLHERIAYQLKQYYYRKALSRNLRGRPTIVQLTQFEGLGAILIGDTVQLGYSISPQHLTASIYIEAREKDATVSIAENVVINNNCSIVADKTSIRIGANTLIGVNVHISDSDGHAMHPLKRRLGEQQCAPVVIGQNVFIGSHVIILKGVEIGENSVIGSGSVVVKSIPANVIAAGNPAKIIKPL